MNSRQRRTFQKILDRPTRSDIRWSEVESLLRALGADTDESRSGSRVHIELNGEELGLHRPHGKELSKSAVEELRQFLIDAGVKL